MNEFEIGQIVKLKSGGPDMTVQRLWPASSVNGNKPQYQCAWFAGKKLEDGRFAPESLEAVIKAE